MLSGDVPTRTLYGHLGWRRIGDQWTFLHCGGAMHADGALNGIEVDTGTDGFLAYQLPAPPGARELAVAVRASLGLLELGPVTITAPVLGAIYRAPLGESNPADSIARRRADRAFKTQVAALAQAHFGAAFNGRRLPAPWADTANMLEKKAFLTKDAVLVVDDFAPTGTTGRYPAAAPRGRSPVPRRRQPCRPRADARRRRQPANLLPARANHLDRRRYSERAEPAGSPSRARADPES